MRLIHLAFTAVLVALLPVAGFAAGAAKSVRAIAFVASNEKGPTDAPLRPYEGVLRSNLRFESFHYVGENSTTVPSGGQATLSVPGGGRLQLQGDAGGSVRVSRGGAVITVSPGAPVVFMGGPAGRGVSGVIVMTD